MKTFGFILTTAMAVALVGCENTIAGFGKDMQKSGQEIQKSVNSNHSSQTQS